MQGKAKAEAQKRKPKRVQFVLSNKARKRFEGKQLGRNKLRSVAFDTFPSLRVNFNQDLAFIVIACLLFFNVFSQ